MRSKKDIPVEEKSYAPLFFILSGLLGLVTIWGFWNETVTRRPWKAIQKNFYQYEYEKAKIELEKAKRDLPDISQPKEVDAKQLNKLEGVVQRAKIELEEALQERKFEQSESDAINYKYQHALHEGHGTRGNAEKWKVKLDELESRIEGGLTQAVVSKELELSKAYRELVGFYKDNEHFETALSTLLLAKKYSASDPDLAQEIEGTLVEINEELESLREDQAKHDAVAKIQEKLDSVSGIKRTFVGSLLESPFTKTRTIVQYYLEDFDYTADRCATCHFAIDKPDYEHTSKERFDIEGDGENKSSYQLNHPLVKVDSETILIDEEEAEADSYSLTENGQITFNDPDIFSEVEISYETGYRPVLRTHPHRDVLLAKHPVEKFGCTLCHGGQGQALTKESAHALKHEEEFWLTPVLGMDEHTGNVTDELRGYMQSNCRRCHAEVMMLDYPSPETGEAQDYSPDLSKGMALFEDLGCHGCHAVEGYPVLKKLDKVGPSLAKIGSKVNSVDWLAGWIKNPSSYLPKTKMPRLFPTQGMTKMVYLKHDRKREGTVRSEGGKIFVRADDGTEYPYAEGEVEKIVDIVKSIATFLEGVKDSTIDQASATFSSDPEVIAFGEEVVKTVGCLACHTVDGLGNDFAPDLEGVGSKVTPTFLRQWISAPKSYDPKTVMPDLRLSDKELDGVVAYLMSLKDSKPSPKVTTTSYGSIPEEINPELGKEFVQLYGCSGCHTIPGFENESKVGVDLGEFGAKRVEELDFGDTTNIEHSWHGWVIGKATNPRQYQTRRIVSRMPVFDVIGEEEAQALAVLLKSFQPKKYPLSYIHQLNEKPRRIDTGRRLVKKYNCQGCHEIEGKGGEFMDVVAAHEGLDTLQAKQFSPPTLQAEGAKVYPDWLFEFLKQPTPIRYGLKVRMPTFGMSDDDATALVEYFSALSDEPFPYETIALQPLTQAELQTGKEIFEALQCISCHPAQGEVIPAGSDKTGRPDLTLAKPRLKADWIVDWLKDPQSFQRGTAMPQNWPKIGGEYQPVGDYAGGDAEKQIELVRDYLISLGE